MQRHTAEQAATAPLPAAASRAAVLALLLRHGTNSTSFQVLEPGFSYWFADAEACVAYVALRGARVVAGAPIAAPQRLQEVAAAFVQDCTRQHLRCTFFGVEQRFLQAMPLPALLVGEQPVWDPARWSTTLAAARTVRSQVARARRLGVRVRGVDAAEWSLPQGATAKAVRRLIDRWHAAKALAPMGFLVQVEPFAFAEQRRFWVAERGDQVVGFLAMVPVYARAGWLLEDLLRDPAAPNGTAELLFDAALRDAAARGSRYVTMGLAPLCGAVSPWLRSASRLGASLYDFRGLHAFKAKLQPHLWEPIYLAHPPQQAGWHSVIDVLAAFAPQGLWRFALDTLLRGPSVVLTWFAALLFPWTLGISLLDGPTWFGSLAVQHAWIVFDLACAVALASLARHWRPWLATTLAWLTAADALLTCLEVVLVPTPTGPVAWILKALAMLAPTLASSVIWGARARHRLWA